MLMKSIPTWYCSSVSANRSQFIDDDERTQNLELVVVVPTTVIGCATKSLLEVERAKGNRMERAYCVQIMQESRAQTSTRTATVG